MSPSEEPEFSETIRLGIANRLRQTRIALKLSQEALSQVSGVSLGSLRRFEVTGEISLKHLVSLAITLDRAEDFEGLFARPGLLDALAAEAGGSVKRRRAPRKPKYTGL